jgi:hypothetical protein
LKQRPFPIAVIVTFLMLAAYPQARAVDISIGGGVLFNWWNPAWNNRKIVLYTPDMYKASFSNWPMYPVNVSYCYGPDISIRFLRNIELSASFRYSRSDMTGAGPSLFPNRGRQQITVSYDLYDTYARAGYYVLGFLMPYAGLRVELIKNHIDFDQFGYTSGLILNMTHASMKGEMLKFTPEVGLHCAVPLSSFFTLIYDVACTFQSGSDTQEYLNMIDQKNPQLDLPPIPTGRYYAVGCSSLLALKFSIPKIDTSISAGGYYRLLGYIQKSRDRGLFDLDGSLDHTYGASCSVSYTFSTGKNKDKRVWIPQPSYPAH